MERQSFLLLWTGDAERGSSHSTETFGLLYSTHHWAAKQTLRISSSPAKSDAVFITLIVTAPVIQITSMFFGVAHLFLELAPQVKGWGIYRSWALRIVTYALQTFFSCLFYQVGSGFA